MNTAITSTSKPKNKIVEWLQSDRFRSQIAEALPSVCSTDRFMRVMFTQMQKVPRLVNCSQSSLFSALITCSSLGIEPDGRRAHLIPYGSDCQLVIDYKGLLELVKRSGDVGLVRAEKVCENDDFVWENGLVRHKIDFRKPRGKAYAYYACATMRDGTIQTEVMTKDEVDAIRSRSRAAKAGPWVTDYDEMAKKTVFRRLTKWLVLSPETVDAIERADRTEFPAVGAVVVPEEKKQRGAIAVLEDVENAPAAAPAEEDAPAEDAPADAEELRIEDASPAEEARAFIRAERARAKKEALSSAND